MHGHLTLVSHMCCIVVRAACTAMAEACFEILKLTFATFDTSVVSRRSQQKFAVGLLLRVTPVSKTRNGSSDSNTRTAPVLCVLRAVNQC